jgi:hypothetical protein
MSRRILVLVVVSSVLGVIFFWAASRSRRSDGPSSAASGSAGVPLAANMPGQIAPVSIGRHLSPDAAKRVTAWSPTSVTMRAAKPGETAPVRSLRIGELNPTEPGPPPNPFVPPKKQLTREEMGMSSGPAK